MNTNHKNKSKHIVRASRLHSFIKSQFINVLILDESEKPITKIECQITFSTGIQKKAITDKNGRLKIPCSEIPEYIDIKLKGVDADTERRVYLNIPSIEKEEDIKQYLSNLGFNLEKDLKQVVMDFQEYYDLEINGKIDETFRLKLQEIYKQLVDRQMEDDKLNGLVDEDLNVENSMDKYYGRT